VVWLYRGQSERFEALLAQHIGQAVVAAQACWKVEAADPPCAPLDDFLKAHQTLRDLMQPLVAALPDESPHAVVITEFHAQGQAAIEGIEALRGSTGPLVASHASMESDIQHSKNFLAERLTSFADAIRALIGVLDQAVRATLRLVDLAEKELGARDDERWPTREIARARKALEVARSMAVERLKQVRHFQRHAIWLIDRFPEARYRDVMGLCKAVSRAEIEAADWSLTPGRYVGVAAIEEDEDFDFIEAMRSIRSELATLDNDATQLATAIQAKLMEITV